MKTHSGDDAPSSPLAPAEHTLLTRELLLNFTARLNGAAQFASLPHSLLSPTNPYFLTLHDTILLDMRSTFASSDSASLDAQQILTLYAKGLENTRERFQGKTDGLIWPHLPYLAGLGEPSSLPYIEAQLIRALPLSTEQRHEIFSQLTEVATSYRDTIQSMQLFVSSIGTPLMQVGNDIYFNSLGSLLYKTHQLSSKLVDIANSLTHSASPSPTSEVPDTSYSTPPTGRI